MKMLGRRFPLVTLLAFSLQVSRSTAFCFQSSPSSATPLLLRPRTTTGTAHKSTTIVKALIEAVTEDGIVHRLEDEETGRITTIIGTAHLSEKSNELVESIVREATPDIVVVELDPKRLERVGFDDPNDIGIPYTTVEDISFPATTEDLEFQQRKPWWSPLQDLFLDAFTQIARKFITGMYNDMGDAMGGRKGGGEFLIAVEAAKQTQKCQRVVLGDRDSLLTIRRAAELALRSGRPFDVLGRLSDISQEEMTALEDRVVSEQGLENAEEADVTVSIRARSVGILCHDRNTLINSCGAVWYGTIYYVDCRDGSPQGGSSHERQAV